MNKAIVKYKKPLIAGTILVILLLGYFFRDKWMGAFRKDAPTPNTTPTNTNNSGGGSSSAINRDTILKKGDRGASVSELQSLMNEELKERTPTLLSFLVVDGIFGDKTEARVEDFTNRSSISINELIIEQPKTR